MTHWVMIKQKQPKSNIRDWPWVSSESQPPLLHSDTKSTSSTLVLQTPINWWTDSYQLVEGSHHSYSNSTTLLWLHLTSSVASLSRHQQRQPGKQACFRRRAGGVCKKWEHEFQYWLHCLLDFAVLSKILNLSELCCLHIAWGCLYSTDVSWVPATCQALR